MGGGGKGWYHGGGSGYLQYQKIWFSNGIMSLNATAGATAKPSSVIYDGISIALQIQVRENTMTIVVETVTLEAALMVVPIPWATAEDLMALMEEDIGEVPVPMRISVHMSLQ